MDCSTSDPAYEGLSIHGRFGRRSYLAWHSLLALGLLLMLGTAALIAPDLRQVDFSNLDSSHVIALVLLLIAQLGALYFHVVFTVRRLHDCALNAYWALLCLIPFANWFLAFYLLFKPGIAQKNRFGEVRHTLNWEKYLAYCTVLTFITGSLYLILVAN